MSTTTASGLAVAGPQQSTVFSVRCGTARGAISHFLRAETHRDMAVWARQLVQGSHSAVMLQREFSFRCFFQVIMLASCFNFHRHRRDAEPLKSFLWCVVVADDATVSVYIIEKVPRDYYHYYNHRHRYRRVGGNEKRPLPGIRFPGLI